MRTEKTIRLSKSCLSEAEKIAVMSVMNREYLGMGQEVRQFEQVLTEFFGRPAVCVSNGTAALQLALQAADVGPGDEVLVQSLTYVASFQAISATGAIPVACDIDPATLTLNWRDAEKRLTSKTKAVMPVHYGGGVGSLGEIYSFAREHRLRVIEDAAHAFGTNYQGKRVGEFGDISCFSFDGIKNITSGEGGCIVTDDEEILLKVRDARLLGVEKDTDRRYVDERSWEFDVSVQGWRYHMSNVMAAIGVEQLKRSGELFRKRKELARQYDFELAEISGLKPLRHNYDEVVPHIYVVRLSENIERQKLREKLSGFGIQTGIHYQPNHQLALYGAGKVLLPIVDAIYPSLLTLPLHPGLLETDVEYIAKRLWELVGHA